VKQEKSRLKKTAAAVGGEFSPRAIARDAAEPIIGNQAKARFAMLRTLLGDILNIAKDTDQGNTETFEEHVKRTGVTEKELAEIQRKVVMNARIFLVMFVCVGIYAEYLLATQESVSARISVIALFFANLAITVAAQHRAWQMKHRQFIGFREWIKQPGRWFV